MPDDPAPPGPAGGAGPGPWDEADLQRAIRAAEDAGLTHFRVEIGPDGTITIVVGSAP